MLGNKNGANSGGLKCASKLNAGNRDHALVSLLRSMVPLDLAAIFSTLTIYMTKSLDSDWLTGVQFFCKHSAKKR